MANLKSSEKKAVNTVLISGHTQFERNVTIQHIEPHEYEYITNTGEKGTYERLLVAYGDNDDKNAFFGNQKGLVLSPKEDSAYPILANVKPGTKGKLVFEMSYSVLDGSLKTDKETGEVSKSPYQKEIECKVVNFIPAKTTMNRSENHG